MKIMPEKIAITVFGKEKDTFAKEMKSLPNDFLHLFLIFGSVVWVSLPKPSSTGSPTWSGSRIHG